MQSDGMRALLGHGDSLHNWEGSPVIGADPSTFCFPTLAFQTIKHKHVESVGVDDSITTSELEFRPDAVLTLCYYGLIVQSANGQGQMRAIRHAMIARGDPDLGWIPNADAVHPDQWDILRSVPGMLTEMTHTIPRFNPLYCSIVYGRPSLDSIQLSPDN